MSMRFAFSILFLCSFLAVSSFSRLPLWQCNDTGLLYTSPACNMEATSKKSETGCCVSQTFYSADNCCEEIHLDSCHTLKELQLVKTFKQSFYPTNVVIVSDHQSVAFETEYTPYQFNLPPPPFQLIKQQPAYIQFNSFLC
ncbi:MAG: hypothetical protein MK193_14695 [Lentisphaeria bacterium]|nr:hypothetical protein [Lentisphaeria bacterium]